MGNFNYKYELNLDDSLDFHKQNAEYEDACTGSNKWADPDFKALFQIIQSPSDVRCLI